MKIPFTEPFYTGREIDFIQDAMDQKKLSGNGKYTKLCEELLEKRYNIKKALLTTSCTDALEICAGLLDIKPGDEVIVPSFTFVSTANAFALRGAKIVFADSYRNHPNIDPARIEKLITPKTKALVPVHYGGKGCNMDKIMEIADTHNLIVIEDAAQAIESKQRELQLGTIGHLGVFSFHDTKNISAGEGGALLINDKRYIERAEIIREKGTNRAAFFKGLTNKYGWIELGSSHIISELNAAFLYAQLGDLEFITKSRQKIWESYNKKIRKNPNFEKPCESTKVNAHNYFLIAKNEEVRDRLLEYLRSFGINATFHFLPLELSEYSLKHLKQNKCPNSEFFSKTLIRLPLFTGMQENQIEFICDTTNSFR